MIYAIKGSTIASQNKFTYEEIVNNSRARFGWSYALDQNLETIKSKPQNEWSNTQKDAWKRANFLLGVKVGDWFVYINLPSYGNCIAVRISKEYSWDVDNPIGDFNHFFEIDKMVQFNRNADNIHPVISSRLKLQGHYWRIKYEKEFFQSIDNDETVLLEESISKNIFHLRNETESLFEEIGRKIHHTHPSHSLEEFVAQIFERVPNVDVVKRNGATKGFGTDHGADLIVTLNTGIPGLEEAFRIVVQVASYKGHIFDKRKVKQVVDGMLFYNINNGLLVTTALKTEVIENEISSALAIVKEEMGIDVNISLMDGNALVKFVLTYASDLIVK